LKPEARGNTKKVNQGASTLTKRNGYGKPTNQVQILTIYTSIKKGENYE